MVLCKGNSFPWFFEYLSLRKFQRISGTDPKYPKVLEYERIPFINRWGAGFPGSMFNFKDKVGGELVDFPQKQRQISNELAGIP